MDDDTHTGHDHARWSGVCGCVYSLAHLRPPSNRVVVDRAGLLPDDRALDIGCGSGAAVVRAAGRVAKGSVMGVDPSAPLLRMARLRCLLSRGRGRITFHRSTARDLPLADGSVTVAWTINSLHHWDDPAADLLEVRRVLAPGGRLIVAEDEGVHAPGSKRAHRGRHVTADQVAGWLADAGFEQVVAERNVLDDLALVTCRRPR